MTSDADEPGTRATPSGEPPLSTRRREYATPRITGREMAVPDAGRLEGSKPDVRRSESTKLGDVLLPPLGVYRLRGLGGAFALSLLLTLAGYVPGLLHRLWLERRLRRNG